MDAYNNVYEYYATATGISPTLVQCVCNVTVDAVDALEHTAPLGVKAPASVTGARLHATPRRSLFTPCSVARGPAHPDCLRTRRVTEGVDIEGNRFRIDDNWREPGRAHIVLDLPWTGVTTFRSRDVIWAEEEPEGRESGVPTSGTK